MAIVAYCHHRLKYQVTGAYINTRRGGPGEDGPDSDVDIGVVTRVKAHDKIVEAFRNGLVAPAAELGFLPSIVGVEPHDIHRLATEQDPWWLALIRDAKTLFGPPPTDLLQQIRKKERKRSEAV